VYRNGSPPFSDSVEANQSTKSALSSLIERKNLDKYTVFNSLSWERNELLDLPQGLAEVTVPACGWTTIDKETSAKSGGKQNKPVKVTDTGLENDLLSASFSNRGELISLVDKETGMEMMSGAGNRFCLYKDIPARFDAWDIDSMTESLLMDTNEPVQVEVLLSTPLIGKIRLTRKIHNSSLTQVISLRKNKRRLDFDTTIDWQESHKLLKVAFPVSIYANEAIHEIQFGHIRRPNHRSRPFDADRFEVCNHKWTAIVEENRGVAILNDSKYGINVMGNSLNLTLLKSALAPDPIADKGIQHFIYGFFYWNGSFSDCDVIREGYELNSPLAIIPGEAGETSIFKLDASNIILETVKLAEDGSNDLILRFYEAKRNHTRCSLYTILPVVKVAQTDMLERFQDELEISNGRIELSFRPFEVKTLRLSMKVEI
jgi:alpha-mannosidase